VSSGTVAAFLTILGYSIYDTIIVFDRYARTCHECRARAFSQIVNRSMSEVLNRSLATSFSTLLAVTSLLIFGGSTLQDFAFAMLGRDRLRYLLVDIHRLAGADRWKEREPGFIRRRLRIAEVEGHVPPYADDVANRTALGAADDEAEAETAVEAETAGTGAAAEPEPVSGAVATAELPGNTATATIRPEGGRRRRGTRFLGLLRASPAQRGTPRPPRPAAQTREEALRWPWWFWSRWASPSGTSPSSCRSASGGDRRRLPRLGDRRDRLSPDRRADSNKGPRRNQLGDGAHREFPASPSGSGSSG